METPNVMRFRMKVQPLIAAAPSPENHSKLLLLIHECRFDRMQKTGELLWRLGTLLRIGFQALHNGFRQPWIQIRREIENLLGLGCVVLQSSLSCRVGS